MALCGKHPSYGEEQATGQPSGAGSCPGPAPGAQPHAISITPEREQAKTTNTKGAARRRRGAELSAMEVAALSATSRPLSPLLSTAAARRLRLRLLPPRCVFSRRLRASPRTRGTFLLIRLARRFPVRIPFVLSISEVRLGTWGVWCCGLVAGLGCVRDSVGRRHSSRKNGFFVTSSSSGSDTRCYAISDFFFLIDNNWYEIGG